MVSVFAPHRLFVVAALTLISFMPLGVHAQGTSPVPPARTYFTDDLGKQTGVKERWGMDAGGERHGMYMKFNEYGLLVESATYVHGVQTGPGVKYERLFDHVSSNPFGKRPDTKYTGMYRAGTRVGTWEGYDDATHKHVVTEVYDASGKNLSTIYLRNGKPIVKTNPAPQPAAPAARPAAPATASLATNTATDKATFAKATFQYNGSAVTGAALAAGNALKSVELCDLVKANPDPTSVQLLLKASKSLGANPTKLIITNAALSFDQLRPLLVLKDPQVDGELIYYGLRGSEEEKGQGSNLIVQRILSARMDAERFYKQEVERRFYDCAKAAKDKYSDTDAYPLRRWLYDEYKDTGDPYKWMNRITHNTEDDARLYPSR